MTPPVFGSERRETLRSSGPGRLDRHVSSLGTLPAVHLRGLPAEMGFQYGNLVGDRVLRNARRLVGMFVEAGLPERLVLLFLDRAWQRLAPHVPPRFIEEMEAVSAGARAAGFDVSSIDLERITAATNLDLYRREERLAEIIGPEGMASLGDEGERVLAGLAAKPPLSCSMFAVWGSRTKDGKCFSMRNLDWASRSGIHEDRLLTVAQPEGRCGFVSMGYAGVLGCLAGMNERGVTLSEVGAFSVREELEGMPWTFMARRVLEEAETLDAAVDIVRRSPHTLGYNYLVAFGDPARFGGNGFRPGAAAMETNFACCEVFVEDDPKEHQAVWKRPDGKAERYGVPLREAIVRADTAFGQRSRALQAADDGPGDRANTGNPRGPDGTGSSYTDCHLPMRDMIEAYANGHAYRFPVRDTRVIEAGPPRKIGAQEALCIAATVAHDTEKLAENDWNIMSVVYAPTDLELWVAYESRDGAGRWHNAPNTGYWHMDLRELLARTNGPGGGGAGP